MHTKEAISAETSETCVQFVHFHSFQKLSRRFEVVSCLRPNETHIYALDVPESQTSVGSVRKKFRFSSTPVLHHNNTSKDSKLFFCIWKYGWHSSSYKVETPINWEFGSSTNVYVASSSPGLRKDRSVKHLKLRTFIHSVDGRFG